MFVTVRQHEVPWIGFKDRIEMQASATTAGR